MFAGLTILEPAPELGSPLVEKGYYDPFQQPGPPDFSHSLYCCIRRAPQDMTPEGNLQLWTFQTNSSWHDGA